MWPCEMKQFNWYSLSVSVATGSSGLSSHFKLTIIVKKDYIIIVKITSLLHNQEDTLSLGKLQNIVPWNFVSALHLVAIVTTLSLRQQIIINIMHTCGSCGLSITGRQLANALMIADQHSWASCTSVTYNIVMVTQLGATVTNNNANY